MSVQTVTAVKAVIYNLRTKLYLILLRSEHDDEDPNIIDLAGGKIEAGEDHKQALTREVREETNLTIEVICPLSTWEVARKHNSRTYGITYLTVTTDADVVLSWEHQSYDWLSFATILEDSIKYPSWLVDVLIKAETIIIKNNAR